MGRDDEEVGQGRHQREAVEVIHCDGPHGQLGGRGDEEGTTEQTH